MKKSNCIFTLLTIFLITINLFTFSQGCLPEGITFTTQQEIDDFQTNYPGCTEIEGDVEIDGNSITNLDGLNIISSIGGYLWITDNCKLANLNGLSYLSSIGGNLKITNIAFLQNFSGFESLTYVAG